MEIRELINQEELIELLASLVAIRSVNTSLDPEGSEKEISTFIQGYLKRHSVEFEIQEVWPDRPNVVATVPGRGDRRLLFESHMDTVPLEGMEIEPLNPRVENGRMYGRGSCDTKAGLAAMLFALKTLKENELTPSASITLAATVDEEFSFGGVSHLVNSGFRADAAVVSEPTELDVIIAHKGCLRWRIAVKGRAAHSSKVHLGINAISHMARIIQAVEEVLEPRYQTYSHPLLGNPTVNVGMIEGGVQVNTVPDYCVIGLDRRTLPGETRESVWREFEEVIETVRYRVPELNAAMEEPFLEDFPLETAENESIVQLASKYSREVAGNGAIRGVPYGTDASKLSRAGIPSIVLGPGCIDQAHSAIEFVSLEQVVQAAEIYLQIMLDFE